MSLLTRWRAPHVVENPEIRQIFESLEEFLDQVTFPPGFIAPTLLAVAPAGWLILDGSEQLIARYPLLYRELGSIESSAGKFKLPDGKDRTMIGAGTHALLTTGGQPTVTLTTGQMPKHRHNILEVLRNAVGTQLLYAAGGNAVATTTQTEEAGGGEAHENMPPFFTGNWMVKT